jgi:hypothetical protein
MKIFTTKHTKAALIVFVLILGLVDCAANGLTCYKYNWEMKLVRARCWSNEFVIVEAAPPTETPEPTFVYPTEMPWPTSTPWPTATDVPYPGITVTVEPYP